MNDTMVVGLLSLAGTLLGSIGGILTANRLTNYRIEALEKKVERHNQVVERTVVVERDLKSAWRAIDELKKKEE